MFTNYSKLAKELAKEIKEDPSLLKAVCDLEKVTAEVERQFVELCLDDLIKLKRLEIVEEANKKDFIGEMREAVKVRIEKEIKTSVGKILEV